MVEYIDSSMIEGKPVGTDPNLSKQEKETTLTVDNDRDTVRIHSDIPTHIKWILSIPDGSIVRFRLVNDTLVGIDADIPKGYVKLQSSNRQSQTNGSMVSYGEKV
jgi:hypothetical protein